MSRPAIEVVRVSRRFAAGPGQAVDALVDVSFEVEHGTCVALLGRNGAGKSTLVKIIATTLLPTTGRVFVEGRDVTREPREARRHLSVMMGGERGLYGLLSARENLRYFGMLAGVKPRDLRVRVPLFLDQVGLGETAARRVETFSKGMRQRLHIAIALISGPRVLVLDEPTVGLDPIEADRLRTDITALRAQGVAVLLTSHALIDVERLSDRVIMLDNGRVRHDLTTSEFARSAGFVGVVKVVVAGHPDETALERWRQHGLEAVGSEQAGTVLRMKVRRWEPEVLHRLGRLIGGEEIRDVEIQQSSLDEAFAHVSNEAARARLEDKQRMRS